LCREAAFDEELEHVADLSSQLSSSLSIVMILPQQRWVFFQHCAATSCIDDDRIEVR
jgi:hypothetical protein